MKIYQCINAVQQQLSATGISKGHRNQQQGYNFRGIDDVYNVLSPLLAAAGLCILPRMLTRTCDERQTAKGGTLFYVTVEAEFDFVCAEDGSKHTVKTFGEAMDSGDKATNKAMSAAYKYAAFQAFAIPTEGDNDADAHTHQVEPRQAARMSQKELAIQKAAIERARDLDELKTAGDTAHAEAMRIGDDAADAALRATYMKRKKELTNPAPQPAPAEQFEDVPQ